MSENMGSKALRGEMCLSYYVRSNTGLTLHIELFQTTISGPAETIHEGIEVVLPVQPIWWPQGCTRKNFAWDD